jgi:hypothetical protein
MADLLEEEDAREDQAAGQQMRPGQDRQDLNATHR